MNPIDQTTASMNRSLLVDTPKAMVCEAFFANLYATVAATSVLALPMSLAERPGLSF